MNNKEEQFLEDTLAKIQDAARELQDKLMLGSNQMEEMQEYFWENYNEFDEYGYEYSMNRQSMEMEAGSLQAMKKEYRQYERMLDTPYFGRIDFIFDGEDFEDSYYIGIGSFTPKKAFTPLIYDWRAPISSLFYDFDAGQASYMAPAGEMTGTITKKMQYKIRKGKMIYALETNLKIDDDILRTELSTHADATLKSIVTTIQKEQNQIIRNEKDHILIVQGSAGSGKTSIALHRIAYLLYHHRDSMKASQILILSPNEIFADYISHILPELGEENILETTLDHLAYKELKDLAEPETRYEYLEKTLNMDAKESLEQRKNLEYKSGESFTRELFAFALMQEDALMELTAFKYGKVSLHVEEMRKLFYEKFSRHPLLKRMDAIAEYIVDADDTLKDSGSQRALEDYDMYADREGFEMSEANESVQHTVSDPGYARKQLRKMYISTNLIDIYNMFLIEQDLDTLPLDLKKIPYEDVYPLLYLKFLLEGTGKYRTMKHLVIDEMQDYTYLQYTILQMMFQCPMTILGDKEQGMEMETASLLEFLPKIFGKSAKVMVLDKSYRSTTQISGFAARLAGLADYSCFDRKGEPVGCHFFEKQEDMVKELVSKLQKQQETDTHAILCKTKKDADKIKVLLEKYAREHDLDMPFDYLSSESEHFGKGISIMPFYLAKGLEFDNVHVVFADEENFPEKRYIQILYIMATRALHTLDFYGVGEEARDIAGALEKQ